MLVVKSASQGIAIGRALVLRSQLIKIEEGHISDIERESSRFNKALTQSSNEIQRLYDKVLTTLGQDKAKIFEAHLMILQDPELTDAIKEKISNEKNKSD